jgi:hypothetical protein
MRWTVTLREVVTDRKRAHAIRQYCRCVIDTKRGNRLVSTHGPGHEPSKRMVLALMERDQRKADDQARTARQSVTLTCALIAVATAVNELRDEGMIGDALVPRILGEAQQIMDDARRSPS